MKQKRHKVFAIITTLLSLSFFLSILFIIVDINNHLTPYGISDEKSFFRDLQYEKYGDILDKTITNTTFNVKSTPALEEYYALGRYYEAAINYKIFMEGGMDEKAAVYKGKMDENEILTGSLSSEIPTILEKLKIPDN